jgi:predicted anti-sigma-YlaC factor YlaD
VVELVSDYLDNELDSDVSAAVEAHLAVCPGCLEYLSQMRTTVGSLRDVASEDLAPSMVSRLVAAFSEAHRGRSSEAGAKDPGNA